MIRELRPLLRRISDARIASLKKEWDETSASVFVRGAIGVMRHTLRRVTGVNPEALAGAAAARRGDSIGPLRNLTRALEGRAEHLEVRALQMYKAAAWDLLETEEKCLGLGVALDVKDGKAVVRRSPDVREYVPISQRYDLPDDPHELAELLVERYDLDFVYVADLDAILHGEPGDISDLLESLEKPAFVDVGTCELDLPSHARRVVPTECYGDKSEYIEELEGDGGAVAGLDLNGSEVLGPWDGVGDFLDDVVELVYRRDPGVLMIDVGAVGSKEGPPYEVATSVGMYSTVLMGGGVGHPEHVKLALGTPGVSGVILGTLLFEGVDPVKLEQARRKGKRLRVHHMGLEEEYLNLIKEGKKTVEGRVKDDKRVRIKPGDKILFNRRLLVKVVDVREYDSFEEMLREEGLENVLPNVDSIEEGIEVYRRFYSSGKEKMFGVLAIEIEPIMDLWEGICD
ncbi:HisA/HisF-related TIM barrel protein [Methanopyrus sp.]